MWICQNHLSKKVLIATKKMFLDMSLFVYSICQHLSSLRSVGAFTFVFGAKHILLNKKVCCFFGAGTGCPHLSHRFYLQDWNWESDILSYPHNRYTPCCSLLWEEYREEEPSRAIQYNKLSSGTFDTRLFQFSWVGVLMTQPGDWLTEINSSVQN